MESIKEKSQVQFPWDKKGLGCPSESKKALELEQSEQGWGWQERKSPKPSTDCDFQKRPISGLELENDMFWPTCQVTILAKLLLPNLHVDVPPRYYHIIFSIYTLFRWLWVLTLLPDGSQILSLVSKHFLINVSIWMPVGVSGLAGTWSTSHWTYWSLSPHPLTQISSSPMGFIS
jgi:hypothetical protein